MKMRTAIDIHCHFNHGVKHDTKETDNYRCDLGFLKAERQRLSIQRSAMTTFSSVLSTERVLEENEYLYALAQEEEFLWQWVVIDPQQPETYKQAKYMLTGEKVLGIKIHPHCHGYPIRQYADDIFSFADSLGQTVVMHPDDMLDTLKYANKYPNMRLIVAHLGTNEEYVKIIQDAKHQNIYTDTSGMASFKNNVIEHTVQQVGSNKILFGTDSYSCAFQRGRIDYANILEEDKENILYNNAMRLFPKLRVYQK